MLGRARESSNSSVTEDHSHGKGGGEGHVWAISTAAPCTHPSSPTGCGRRWISTIGDARRGETEGARTPSRRAPAYPSESESASPVCCWAMATSEPFFSHRITVSEEEWRPQSRGFEAKLTRLPQHGKLVPLVAGLKPKLPLTIETASLFAENGWPRERGGSVSGIGHRDRHRGLEEVTDNSVSAAQPIHRFMPQGSGKAGRQSSQGAVELVNCKLGIHDLGAVDSRTASH